VRCVVKPGETQTKSTAKADRSQGASILTGAEHPQHPYVAGGLVAIGVQEDLVKRSEAAVTRQFTHARMLTDRIEAGVFTKFLDRSPNRRQLAPCRRTGTRLGQPVSGGLEIPPRKWGINQPARHGIESARFKATRWWRG
jgi:hypothetical protein